MCIFEMKTDAPVCMCKTTVALKLTRNISYRRMIHEMF